MTNRQIEDIYLEMIALHDTDGSDYLLDFPEDPIIPDSDHSSDATPPPSYQELPNVTELFY